MWILPTFGRPGRCQEALDSIIASGEVSPGYVFVDGDPDIRYDGLRLPLGWGVIRLERNVGVCGVLNHALVLFPDEPWYGFITDDSIVKTQNFDAPLIAAAGTTGFANSADGWQAHKRMHGAVVFGGDLLRALGWWAPPGLKHSFCDDAWERIAHALGNWRHARDVMVEHRHARNRKAEQDKTYDQAYATFEDDRAQFHKVLAVGEIPAAIARAIPVVLADAHPDQQRLARAKSRSVMIATPVARDPCVQYTIAFMETCLTLYRSGIQCQTRHVIGSSNLPRARNELVARFLASDCTDLIFIDDDMQWHPQAVLQLLASDKEVVAGVGRKRVDKPNLDPEVWCVHFGEHGGRDLVRDDMGCIQVERVGTGFLKIARSALERMIVAHPEWKRAGHAGLGDAVQAQYYQFFRFDPDDVSEMGEDYVFCDRHRALGGTIWINPDIELGHVGTKVYSGAISELMQPADAEPVEQMMEAAE